MMNNLTPFEDDSAAPLARRRVLPEMHDNREGVSPVPSHPLSHTVRWPINMVE